MAEMAEYPPRMGRTRTHLLALGAALGALAGVFITDRIIHYTRRRAMS